MQPAFTKKKNFYQVRRRFIKRDKFDANVNIGKMFQLPASWSSGNAFVSGAEGLRFKSRASQIGHCVANGSPPLRYSFERSCVARAQ